MKVSRNGDRVDYHHYRTDRVFEASYGPDTNAAPVPEGGFEEWSTSRYCLYAQNKRGRFFRGHIHHPPWPLQFASVELRKNTMLDSFAVGERHPSALYAKEVEVVVYPLEKLPE